MEFSLPEGEFHLLSGPASLKIVSGAVEIVGAELASGAALSLPQGKRVPLKTLRKTALEIEGGKECFQKMETNSIPSDWNRLAERILSESQKGKLYKVLVLGEMDTGKTFFSTYLANRLVNQKKRVAVLDCDTGQSDIGPPGTLGMLLLNKPMVFFAEEKPTHLYFIGAHSPGLHILPALTGLSVMLAKAREAADFLVVDTPGWVQGDGARAFRRAELEILQPELVVLMQRGDELEHLVRPLPREAVVRLAVSKKASSTSQMERKKLRELLSCRYFQNARELEIPFSQIYTDRCYLLTGKSISLEGTLHAEKLSGWEGTLVVTEKPLENPPSSWPQNLGKIKNVVVGSERGLLVALLGKEKECLALARIAKIDFKKKCFILQSPYGGAVQNVCGIQFGSLKIKQNGEEDGFIEPGSL